MDREFISYAHQDLSRKKIKKYASQYEGVDMTIHLGADEDNFPFLLGRGGEDYSVMIWNSCMGIMLNHDEDPVRNYATAQYLLNRAYLVFDSIDDAQRWADEHDWPRKIDETEKDA